MDRMGRIFWGVGCMNPLRLASLDASPFCGAKGGGKVCPAAPGDHKESPLRVGVALALRRE